MYNLIGTTYTSRKNSTLTVISKQNKEVGKDQKYVIECSICSEDKELFPVNFLGTASSIKNKKVPCGCSPSYRYNKEQQLTRIIRACKIQNQDFLGFNGEWKKSHTKLNMSCNVCNHHWGTVTINNLLSKGSGCPVCGDKRSKEGSLKTHQDSVKSFMQTGSFHEKDIFKRNEVKTDSRGYYSFWDFTCFNCSTDEYVQAGLCSGVWTTARACLMAGHKPCRCASNPKYTQEQREFQLKRLCSESKATFKGWVETTGYSTAHSEFNWVCSQGHERVSTVNGFTRGKRCRTCALTKNFNLIKGMEEEADICYLLEFKDSINGERFIKIGRSFARCYRERLNYFKGFYDVTELAANENSHANIVKEEANFHNYLSKYHYIPKVSFGGSVNECFTLEALDLLEVNMC